MNLDHLDDGALLDALPASPEAFAALYRRYERAVLAYHRRRVRDADQAADLAAETFAAALHSLRRRGTPNAEFAPWLFTIARNKWLDAQRRQRVSDDMRRRLAMEPVVIDDDQRAAIDRLADAAGLEELVAELPEEQRAAVVARIIDDRDYGEIAIDLACSEQVVRKRVSRALATLRDRWEDA